VRGFTGARIRRHRIHRRERARPRRSSRAATRRQVPFPDSVEAAIIPDLKNPVDWNPILRGVDIIVHLAGLAHVKIPDTAYSEYDQINWIGTQRLAQAAKEAAIERFVYISSVRAQVGASAAHPVREQDEPCPTDQYGRSKLAAEWAIRAAGVPFTIFRPVVVYGPHPKGNILTLVRLARSPFPLPVANFSGRRALLGIDNLISAIVFALNNPITIGEAYMLADSAPMTVSEIFAILRKLQGRSVTTINVPQVIIRLSLMMCGHGDLWSRFSGDLVVDTSKLELVGWRPVIDTYEGLRRMLRAEDGESTRP
jgi:nucleoside-diphosphate-sugar epimerase